MIENKKDASYVLVSSEQLDRIEKNISKIYALVQDKLNIQGESDNEYITAQEFMDKTFMCRSKFDEMNKMDEIKVIKKGRKLFVLKSEVARYFS